MQNFVAFENTQEEIEYARQLNQLTETQVYQFLDITKDDLSKSGVLNPTKDALYQRRMSCLLNQKNFHDSNEFIIDYINDVLIEKLDWNYENIARYCSVALEEFTHFMNKQPLPCDIEKTIIIRVMSLGRGFL